MSAEEFAEELATNLTGRYASFHVYPFVLSEIQEFYDNNEMTYTREQLFTVMIL